MQNSDQHSTYVLQLDTLELIVAPADASPFEVAARVEEQDVALLLGTDEGIHQPDDKPVWYLSHKLVSQTLQQPGDLLLRQGRPLRLLAIVHDFDQDPSWNSAWVEQALGKIAEVIEERQLNSLALPLLATRHGRVELDECLALVSRALLQQPPACLTRIWLVEEDDRRDRVFARLQAIVSSMVEPH